MKTFEYFSGRRILNSFLVENWFLKKKKAKD